MNLEKIKKIASMIYAISILLILVVAVLILFSNISTPGGYKIYSVQSGSMSPNIPVGNLVVVLPERDYKQGDIITFATNPEGKPTTHRIIKIENNNQKQFFKTKGDANDIADSGYIQENHIIGKVKFQIPVIGYLLNFTKTLPGLIILIVIPATIIVFTEILNIKSELVKMFAKSKSSEIESTEKVLKENSLKNYTKQKRESKKK